jgi:hypothetical protein
MRKFIVSTRTVPGCQSEIDAPTIVEVEGEQIAAVEDPSVRWLPTGEFRFRILQPTFLYDPRDVPGHKGKVMVAPVYYSHAIFSSVEEAKVHARRLITASLEFAWRKQKTEYTQVQIEETLSRIQEVMLP